MGDQRLPIYVPIMPMVIGALFVLIAIARPAFMWNMGKVRAGREWVGDNGVSAFFIVIGLILIAIGVGALLKR